MSDLNISGNYLKNGTNILSSKQDTLVSGTNIKTINGNSVLGSGDLTIGGGGGGGIGGVFALFPFSGSVINNLIVGPTNSISQSVGASQVYLSPFQPAKEFTISQLGCEITSATASGRFTIVIYSCDSTFNFSSNNTVNFEVQTGIMDNSTTGIKTYNLSTNFTFTTDKIYWMGVVGSLGVIARAAAISNGGYSYSMSPVSNLYLMTAFANCNYNPAPSTLNLTSSTAYTQVIRMLVA